MNEEMDITYKVVLSFNERTAKADVRIDNLRHSDIPELRRKIDALEELLRVDVAALPNGAQP